MITLVVCRDWSGEGAGRHGETIGKAMALVPKAVALDLGPTQSITGLDVEGEGGGQEPGRTATRWLELLRGWRWLLPRWAA